MGVDTLSSSRLADHSFFASLQGRMLSSVQSRFRN
jgi:hypothetical protein